MTTHRELNEDWCPEVWDRVHLMTLVWDGYAAQCRLCGYIADENYLQSYKVKEERDDESEDETTDPEASQERSGGSAL